MCFGYMAGAELVIKGGKCGTLRAGMGFQNNFMLSGYILGDWGKMIPGNSLGRQNVQEKSV